MFRWQDVDAVTIDEMTVKMYREPLTIEETQIIKNEKLELDHYAYKYLNSELLMYQVLEANFVEYMEARGDTGRIKNFLLPIKIKEDTF